MNSELQRQLEIALCNYSPYGLKVIVKDEEYIMKSCFVTGNGNLHITTTTKAWIDNWPKTSLNITTYGIKLILHPLSDLIKEIKHNRLKLSTSTIDVIKNRDWGLIRVSPYLDVQKLFEGHFDVFGLINQGYAVDINELTKNKQS